MYSGPFYYHQPGFGQHGRASELLKSGIGDGVIVPVKTTRKASKSNFDQFLLDCRQTSKNILLDTEDFIPENTEVYDPKAKSKILLESDPRRQYVASSLKFQHDNHCSAYILPNFETHSISPAWFQVLNDLGITGREWIAQHGDESRSVLLTIAIPANHIIDHGNCQDLLDKLTSLRSYVDGFYINLIEIPEILTNDALFHNLLYFVFRLKWQQFKVVFSKAGSWVGTMFPLGLDTFGNDGFKSQQQVRSKRDKPKGGGRGGPPSYVNVWSPITMSYIRYPDDAEKLHHILSLDEKRDIYGSHSGFAPPVDRSPDNVYAAKAYKQRQRLNHYSASMALLAQKYISLTLNERVSLVQRQLRVAFRVEQQIGNVLGDQRRGQEKQVWFEVFTKFVDDFRDDLEEMYS